jgi:aspartate/methionine/tyrosine aminotransferase
MTELQNSLICSRLAKRVASQPPELDPVSFKGVPSPAGLHEYLSEHLAAGETHYTTRPGLTELRQAIGRELGSLGGPDCGADGVIVTQGEGEALYVTLLGLGIGAESVVAITPDCVHRKLLSMLGTVNVGTDDPEASGADACLCEFDKVRSDAKEPVPDGRFEIVALGGLLFSENSSKTDLSVFPANTVLIGHLDSLSGLDHFRLGYVAGPPDVVKRIQTWKQALSICSAAPSQRAAMFAISQGGVS